MGESHPTIEENSTEYVGRYSATDPEGVATSWTALSGPDRAHFELDDDGNLSFTNVPDYDARDDANRDNRYQVTVGASDGSLTDTLDVTVIITDVNEPPEIAGPDSVDFVEHDTGIVATYTATDPEGGTVVWHRRIRGRRSACAFSLRRATACCVSAAPPDYETGRSQYTLTVQASDGPNADDLSVTINVINLEEPGTLSLSSEQPQVGSVLTATLTDPDGVHQQRVLDVGAVAEPQHLDDDQRGDGEQLHARRRRPEPLPAGDGRVQRRARRGQAPAGVLGTTDARAAAGEPSTGVLRRERRALHRRELASRDGRRRTGHGHRSERRHC